MASVVSASGTETPTSEGPITPKQSGHLRDTIQVLKPGDDTDNFEPPTKIRAAKLKLKLRNILQKPIEGAIATPHGSVRSSTDFMEHMISPDTRKTSLQENRPTKMRTLWPKPANTTSLTELQQPLSGAQAQAILKHVKNAPFDPAYNSFAANRGNAPAAIHAGAADHPIDVDALPSPPPHLFANRPVSYFAPLPLQYRPSRPQLPPTLAMPNGATIHAGKVSGHKSHDVYKLFMEGKEAPAPPGFRQHCAKLSAEIAADKLRSSGAASSFNTFPAYDSGYGHLHGRANQPYTGPLQHQNYAQDYRAHTVSYHTPIHGYPMFPVLNEAHLRQRAVQFVLDHSRPRPRKRRLSDDRDETSSSEYKDTTHPKPHQKKKSKSKQSPPTNPTQTPATTSVSTPSTGASEANMIDRNLQLTELVEHTQLLTALLMTYPRSEDQKGMREDVAMLATVVEKRLERWGVDEGAVEEEGRERRRTGGSMSPSPLRSRVLVGDEWKGESGLGVVAGMGAGGRKVRRYLLGQGDVWNVSGVGAEDAFAVGDGDANTGSESVEVSEQA